MTRLQIFESEIAPAWKDTDLEVLVAVRRNYDRH
jgi:hypothetical protein